MISIVISSGTVGIAIISNAINSLAIISNAIISSAIFSSAAIDIMKRFSLRCAAVAICVSASLAGCETVNTTQPGAIGVDRKQVMSPLVSEQELRQGAVTSVPRLFFLLKQQPRGDARFPPAPAQFGFRNHNAPRIMECLVSCKFSSTGTM